MPSEPPKRSSLVHELVNEALSQKAKVSDLLRKALVIAMRLSVKTSTEWITKELEGYSENDKAPPYREVSGEIKARNEQGVWIPFQFLDFKTHELMSKRVVGQPIGQLEHMLEISQGPGNLAMSYSAKTLASINSEDIRAGYVPHLFVDRSRLHGVIEGARNATLKWGLRLEADNILGEGQSFSPEEKEKASQNIYNIERFAGVLGNVTAHNAIIGDYASIHEELKRLGIPQDERNAIENILDDLNDSPSPEEKTSLLSRGSDWILKNGPALGEMAERLKHLFESSGAS